MVDTDDTQRTMDDGRLTTPRVWHKLPTGELKRFQVEQGNAHNKSCPVACSTTGDYDIVLLCYSFQKYVPK